MAVVVDLDASHVAHHSEKVGERWDPSLTGPKDILILQIWGRYEAARPSVTRSLIAGST
jgi:hypothetical protein